MAFSRLWLKSHLGNRNIFLACLSLRLCQPKYIVPKFLSRLQGIQTGRGKLAVVALILAIIFICWATTSCMGPEDESMPPVVEPVMPEPEPEPEPIGPDIPGEEPPEPDPTPQDSKPPQIPPCAEAVPASVTANNVLSIPDPNLETALKSHMGKSESDPIYLSEMAALTKLEFTGARIGSLEGMQYARNLVELLVGYNAVCDLSPLSGLTKLERLWINSNPINLALQVSVLEGLSLEVLHLQGLHMQDLSIIAGLTGLEALYLGFSRLPDLSPLENLVNLEDLAIVSGGVSDISALSSLTELQLLNLQSNRISDISPLVSNGGLGSGDLIDLRNNPLSYSSTDSHVPQLEERGANVLFDELLMRVEDGPQIYNGNVFVMPVDSDITRYTLPYESLTAEFYRRFEDVFDFLIIVLNLKPGEFRDGYLGLSIGVSNDVRGIGEKIFSYPQYGSGGKLKSIVKLVEYDGILEGPLLHEIMHLWGNAIIRPFGHWGFTSADGQLGGFARETLRELGNDRYSAADFPAFGYAYQGKAYSPIELYLAGFIEADAVPDLLVAENASFVREGGRIARTEEGHPIFTATAITTLTIEDIISEHGERVPGVSGSQKDFRAAVIFLIDEDNPATREALETVSRHASWFSNPANDGDPFFNFYEATGGRATIRMNRLSEAEK